MRAPRCAVIGALAGMLLVACGDRSPPALWPEPPPPTLAKPIGIDEPVRAVTDPSGPPTQGDDAAATSGMDATAEPAPTSADAPYPAGGDPPITADPMPRDRLPMPLLAP